jgi:hypothetical protein
LAYAFPPPNIALLAPIVRKIADAPGATNALRLDVLHSLIDALPASTPVDLRDDARIVVVVRERVVAVVHAPTFARDAKTFIITLRRGFDPARSRARARARVDVSTHVDVVGLLRVVQARVRTSTRARGALGASPSND